jgi:hypothetical protein
MQTRTTLGTGVAALLASGAAISVGQAEEQPRRGGTLTYMCRPVASRTAFITQGVEYSMETHLSPRSIRSGSFDRRFGSGTDRVVSRALSQTLGHEWHQ